jgi:hypothetical protein
MRLRIVRVGLEGGFERRRRLRIAAERNQIARAIDLKSGRCRTRVDRASVPRFGGVAIVHRRQHSAQLVLHHRIGAADRQRARQCLLGRLALPGLQQHVRELRPRGDVIVLQARDRSERADRGLRSLRFTPMRPTRKCAGTHFGSRVSISRQASAAASSRPVANAP